MQPTHQTHKVAGGTGRNVFSTPTITEDDLLSFQSSHFGDESVPHQWFVDAETALSYEPHFDEWEEGGMTGSGKNASNDLGHYVDGAKRTLTDDQIAMFRHSELEQLARYRQHLEEEEDEDHEDTQNQDRVVARGPSLSVSDASSIDVDLAGLSRPTPLQTPPTLRRQQSRTSVSTSTSASRKLRENEIPYDERHKRKWEQYIDDTDPREGSLTHRRMARELDEQQETRVELEY